MTDPTPRPAPRPAASPVDRLSAVREWLWRHSSQPNGDPWDGDPEHLDRAAQLLLDDLAQRLIGTDSSTGAAVQHPGRAGDRHEVPPSAPALVAAHGHRGQRGGRQRRSADRRGHWLPVGGGRAVALLTSGAMAGVKLGLRGWGRVRQASRRWPSGLEEARVTVA
jgi:hypothetical protein